jgi:hypothetical protein
VALLGGIKDALAGVRSTKENDVPARALRRDDPVFDLCEWDHDACASA